MLNQFDTYKAFKDSFYKKVPDLSLLNCGEINLLKIVLDGLKVDYRSLGNFRTPLFFPRSIFRLYNRFKRVRLSNQRMLLPEVKRNLNEFDQRKFLFIASYDLAQNGKISSSYFDAFFKILDREQYVAAHCIVTPLAPPGDVNVSVIRQLIESLPMTEADWKFYDELRTAYQQIAGSRIFNDAELENIRIAINKFFYDYRAWSWLISHLNPSACIFRCHYHQEGMILALKQKGITCVELQHGLIALEDIFYVFPNQVKVIRERALFADKIWVYGEYWKQVLLHGAEYPSNTIDIIGYYNYIDRAKSISPALQEFIDKRRTILIASQTGSHDVFLQYVSWMSVQEQVLRENWAIVFKPHPNEPVSLFESFKSLNNVFLTTDPIDTILPHADVVVSIYSTVLFDAKRYGKECYSLFSARYADYIRSFVDAGVSKLLQQSELPSASDSEETVNDFSYFYCTFDSKSVSKLISEL